MTPHDLRNFAESGLKALIFISNFHFASEVGYFAEAAETAPLLHTWSLAIEEQFYIFFPLFLLAITRFGKKNVFGICSAIFTLSFGFSIFGLFGNQDAAFFMPHLRFWELLMGALLALGIVPKPKTDLLATLLGFAGCALIVLSLIFYTDMTPFPGYAALAPTLGTSLLIHAAIGLPNRLLSLSLLVGVGRISYSVYLWHWPLVVFAKYIPATAIYRTGDGRPVHRKSCPGAPCRGGSSSSHSVERVAF